MLKLFFVLVIYSFFYSCGNAVKNSRSQSPGKFELIAKSKSFADFIYFFDSTGYYELGSKEKEENLKSLIFGFFYNDSVVKRPGILSRKVPTCIKLMNDELTDSINYLLSQNKKNEIVNFIFTDHLIKLSNRSRYNTANIQSEKKTKVVFLFSISLGNKFDSFFSQAVEICRRNNCLPVIISLDPIYYAKF